MTNFDIFQTFIIIRILYNIGLTIIKISINRINIVIGIQLGNAAD